MGAELDIQRLCEIQAAIHQLIDQHLDEAKAGQQNLCLLVIELGSIDRVTARHGYAFRYSLLEQYAAHLQASIRDKDMVRTLPQGRLVIVVPGLKHAAQTTLAANKILRLSAAPFKVQRLGKEASIVQFQHVTLNPTIGIALFPDHADSSAVLLQKAELALENARKRGSLMEMYCEDQNARLVFPWDVERDLAKSIEQGDFELAFQPKISLTTGEPASVEALIRWNRPGQPSLSPEVFMQVADETGQIQALTKYVINSALRQVAEWPQCWGRLPVAVNLTPSVIQSEGLVDLVADARSIWGVGEGGLILEVTESGLMESPALILERLHQLRQAGNRISIDDFGTGYSSFSYFKNIPAHELKIDKSFVTHLLSNEADAKIVRTVIELAHNFGLKVVAEGVEDLATLDALMDLGCDYAQGYVISKPLSQADFIAWMNEREQAQIGAS